jgi:hypothetical protein
MTDSQDVRKIVLIMTVGLCDAIDENAVSIDEAGRCLFAPRTMQLFEQDPELRDIIHKATEFEDIESLLPAKLGQTIADVRRQALEALKNMPECDYGYDHNNPPWLYRLLRNDG